MVFWHLPEKQFQHASKLGSLARKALWEPNQTRSVQAMRVQLLQSPLNGSPYHSLTRGEVGISQGHLCPTRENRLVVRFAEVGSNPAGVSNDSFRYYLQMAGKTAGIDC